MCLYLFTYTLYFIIIADYRFTVLALLFRAVLKRKNTNRHIIQYLSLLADNWNILFRTKCFGKCFFFIIKRMLTFFPKLCGCSRCLGICVRLISFVYQIIYVFCKGQGNVNVNHWKVRWTIWISFSVLILSQSFILNDPRIF